MAGSIGFALFMQQHCEPYGKQQQMEAVGVCLTSTNCGIYPDLCTKPWNFDNMHVHCNGLAAAETRDKCFRLLEVRYLL